MADRAELTRLILQVERDALAQKHLKTLLTDAAATVARRREELRVLRTRIARRSTRAAPKQFTRFTCGQAPSIARSSSAVLIL